MLDEDNIHIEIRRINQKIKQLDGTIRDSIEKFWLEDSEYYDRYGWKANFENYVEKREKDEFLKNSYLGLKKEDNNFMVTMYGNNFIDNKNSEWTNRWIEDLKVLFDLFDKDNEEILKFIGKWNRDFEIYRNIYGREEMGNMTYDEMALSHQGQYCIKFDFGFDDFFRNEQMKNKLEELHIFNVSTHYDNLDLVMFFKDFTIEELKRIFRTYNILHDYLIELNKTIDETKDNFFKEKEPWTKI